MFPIDASNLQVTPPPVVFYVRYLEQMAETERTSAIDALLTSQAPLDTVLLFDRALSATQRQRVLGLFDEHPPTTSAAWLSLSDLLLSSKQDTRALDALAKAAALLLAAQNDQNELRGRINAAAKNLGREDLAEQPPDVELLKSLGFVEVTPDAELADFEFDVSGMAAYVARTTDGKLHTVILRAVKDAAAQGGYRIARVENFPHGRAWTSGDAISGSFSPTYPYQLAGLGLLEVQITRLDGDGRYRAHAQLRGATPSQ